MGYRHKSDTLSETSPINEMSLSDIRKNDLDKEDFYVRDSEICWLDDKWLYDIIMPKVFEANKLAGWNWKIDQSENFQFTKYTNSGFYGWHMDGESDHFGKYKRFIYGVSKMPCDSDGNLPPGYVTNDAYVGKVRKISLTINLAPQTEYDGGDLKFDYGRHADIDGETMSDINGRKQGSIVLFPSFLPHCVTPVTRGTRYSLVLWVLGDPWE